LYLASPDIVEVEFVEAKGPHCRVRGHRAGQMVSIGSGGDLQEN